MKINWKVRRKNPLFWFQIFLAIAVPIGAYFGISGEDITTWAILGKVIIDAISNPYVLSTILAAVYAAVNDPTTAGHRDSERALGFDEPRKDL